MALISSQETIWSLIPQQPPFVLVDKLITYESDCIISGFCVPEGHLLTNGNGQLSEAGVIEHFAQTIALHQGYESFLSNMSPPVGYIGSVKNFEIFSLPNVGDELRTTINILQRLFGVTAVRGEVKLGDQVIAVGEMRTVIAKERE